MSLLLHECLTLSESGRAVRVDREKGTIGPVKVLGWKSANGREYLPQGVKAALYEGRRVCVGHHQGAGDRSPLDTYGLLEGVRVEDSGVFADRLRLLDPTGPFERKLLSAAETAPHLYGLSHTARGVERAGSGGRVIESVESVESVDLVTDPATVKGLYESRVPPVTKKLRELAESLQATRPRYSRALTEMAEAGIMSPDAAMDEPAAPAGEKDHEAAILDAAAAVLRDDGLSVPDKLKKIKQLLKMTEGGGGDSSAADDGPAEESRRRVQANLTERLGKLEAEKLVRKAAQKAGLALTEALVERGAACGLTEAQAAEYVAELKAFGGAGVGEKPRSAPPFTPPENGKDGKDVRESKGGRPSDDELKAYAARINGR